jgi:hypothetical protein
VVKITRGREKLGHKKNNSLKTHVVKLSQNVFSDNILLFFRKQFFSLYLDLDPHSSERLDPVLDSHKLNADPEHQYFAI